jgi:hypothetical protein
MRLLLVLKKYDYQYVELRDPQFCETKFEGLRSGAVEDARFLVETGRL